VSEIVSEIAEWEKSEIEAANAGGRPVVVFVHGLWLLSSSWAPWRSLFEQAGYATIAPGWPDDPPTVEAAREDPDVFAHKMVQQVTDHYLAAISELVTKPAVIGHSFGGLIAQKIAGEGASAATVTIDNAPFRGVLPLPASSLKSAEDNTVPLAITRATYKQQSKNPGITEIVEVPGRGHSLTIDHGWQEVAETALAFVQRFVS